MLERPEFVLHSQVSALQGFVVLLSTTFLVRCSVSYVLTIPLKSGIWRNIFWSNPPLGYEIKTLARLENPVVCGWPHPPHLRHANGRNSERPQLDYQQYGRAGMQLVGGHVGSTSGSSFGARSHILLIYSLTGIPGTCSRWSQQNWGSGHHHT